MSEGKKIIAENNPNQKDKIDIIEEKVGNTNVPFSEVFNLYTKRILDEAGEHLFKGDDLINLDITEKNKFKIEDSIGGDLIYDGETVFFPIIVSFEKDNINKTYKMFTQKYFDKIYNEMQFINPMLLIGNSYKKFENKKNYLFTLNNQENEKYKIFEKQEEHYVKFYSTTINARTEYVPSDLTPNFNYYFTSPKKPCKMKFSFNSFRKKNIVPIFSFNTNKIHSIFGPYGSGKTTSLILASRNRKDTCYLNLNSLYKFGYDLYIWKYILFLNELYNIFRKEEEEIQEKNSKTEVNEVNKGIQEEKLEESKFKIIKKKILQCNHFWEAISTSIKFCIENRINSIFILDQYKEELDPGFSQFKDIKILINENKNEYVKLIVASSTNNLDIRNFIIQKYIQKISEVNLINDYTYIRGLFKLTDISGLIDVLPKSKKKVLEEYFSNIPSYFYIIYDSQEEDINTTIGEIKKTITEDIESFYNNNKLTRENHCFIIQNYLKIGDNLDKEKEDESGIIENSIIERFIKILPIKYFTFDIKNKSIVKIYFYFKLAKICFLEFMFKKFYEYFEQPKIEMPERTIGDILEIILIENLKNVSSEKIDQIVKVNSLWEINNVQGLDKSRVNGNNIIITQESDVGKKVDFGLLFKGEILVLVQCKKSLSEKPTDYVKIRDIEIAKNNLHASFEIYFGCDIKKIKLLYLTGIYFTDKDKTKYHSWTKNNIPYNHLEEITSADEIPLVFFDVQEKIFLIKKNYNDNFIFEQCSIINIDSFIYNEEIFSDVKIESDNILVKQIMEGLKNHFENKLAVLSKNSKVEEKSDSQTNIKIYEEYLDKKIIPKNRVIVKEPDSSLFSNTNENVLTTFKIKNKQYFCYYDSDNKKMKYVKVEDGKAEDFEFKDLEIYFLQKKTGREKSKKKNK